MERVGGEDLGRETTSLYMLLMAVVLSDISEIRTEEHRLIADQGVTG